MQWAIPSSPVQGAGHVLGVAGEAEEADHSVDVDEEIGGSVKRFEDCKRDDQLV